MKIILFLYTFFSFTLCYGSDALDASDFFSGIKGLFDMCQTVKPDEQIMLEITDGDYCPGCFRKTTIPHVVIGTTTERRFNALGALQLEKTKRWLDANQDNIELAKKIAAFLKASPQNPHEIACIVSIATLDWQHLEQ